MLFLVALFFIKNKTVFKNQANQEGLAYGNETLESFVNKDTDGDGILDWEENLWGTDPLKKDTNDDGTGDDVEVAKMKAAQGMSVNGKINLDVESSETLTETDKFSRELFSTIATLSQAGEINQETVEKLSNSLVEQIKAPSVQKVFLMSDLKIIQDNSLQAIKNYDSALNNIFSKKPLSTDRTVIDILNDFMQGEEDVNVSVLVELDPIIIRTGEIIDDMRKVSVPESLASLHLEVVNGMQRLFENLKSLKLFDTDIVLALGAISQYETNTDSMTGAMVNLNNAIQAKIK